MVLKNRLSYSQRLFLLLVIFAFALTTGFIVFQYEREKQYKVDNLNARLQIINTQIVDAIVDGKNISDIQENHIGKFPHLRVTLIDTMGNVLYDNPYEWKDTYVPNHRNRAEVVAAIEQGEGCTISRLSENDHLPYFYSATLHDDIVVRTALPYDISLVKLLTVDLSYLWIILSITIIICLFGYFVTRYIGRSVRRLQQFATLASRNEAFEELEDFPADELGEISRHIVQLYLQLQQSISERNKEHAKLLHEEQEKIRLKRQLTNNINHELKTPVSVIRGYLETIINNPNIDTETCRQFIEKSFVQTERLQLLLQDVSTITRMEEAAHLIERELTDIYTIVQEMITDISHTPAEQQMRIRCNFERPLPIYGNTGLLTSVFRNLTDNAIAYSGGRDIFINLISETEEEYSFSFADNGIGIDEEHLSHIFERFYRVDKGRSRKLGGTGLGLSIVKNSILFHGGTIEARNRREGGLEFLFTLKKSENVRNMM